MAWDGNSINEEQRLRLKIHEIKKTEQHKQSWHVIDQSKSLEIKTDNCMRDGQRIRCRNWTAQKIRAQIPSIDHQIADNCSVLLTAAEEDQTKLQNNTIGTK